MMRGMFAAQAALLSVLYLGGCGVSEEAQQPESTPQVASSQAPLAAVNCDKVTTLVCPDGTCLCKQKDCTNLHNGDYAPCNGPPVSTCTHDFTQQFCYPVGQPIDCSANGVPVNRCGLPCRSGGVTYTNEPNGCCRGERKCLPPKPIIVQPPQPIEPIEPGEVEADCVEP